MQSWVISGIRRTSREAAVSPSYDCNNIAILPLEINAHADTICTGRNCQIEYYMPYECSVSPFLEDYQDQQNVRICTALTATTIPYT
jgi:hypothetical protein